MSPASQEVLVGVMSGTSLDGVSAAVARFKESDMGVVTPELLSFITRPYDAVQRQRLAGAITGATPRDYARLDFDLGAWLADAAAAAIAEAGVAKSDIAAIASHGQTVWHDPPHATWQFGQSAVIAERIGLPVISDFRVRDVAAGGQGAPLVAIVDAMLFSAPDHWRAMLNLGGIGNVQIVPPGGALASVRGFDTGPGVVVIDGVVHALVPGAAYDRDGEIARRGKPVTAVVDRLLHDPFFASDPPKTTGRELFSPRYVQEFIEQCAEAEASCSTEDIVASAVSFTARSVALAFESFVPEPVSEVLVSGGGARNPALLDAMRDELGRAATDGRWRSAPHVAAPPAVVRFDDVYWEGEAKEAVAFAFLGWLHLRARPGNVPNATGARGPRILGKLTPA